MSNVSARAASARENARQRDGKFGSFQLEDAGTDADLDMSWLDNEAVDEDPFAEPEPKRTARRRGARTDVHAPGSPDFHPEAYKMLGVYYEGGNDERLASSETYAQRDRQIAQLTREGYVLGHGNSDQCGHCGSRMNYAALMVREDVREYIFVGEDCLESTFDQTSEEFARRREEVAHARVTQARKGRIAALVDEHPLLADLTYPQLAGESEFTESISGKLMRDGALTDRQIEAAEKALLRGIDRRMARQAREERQTRLREAGVQVPTGKVRVQGTITSTKVVESQYGSTLKARVESEEGWSVWTTVPRGIEDPKGLEGAVIAFNATVEQSRDDQLFGFASRPTKAEVITPAEHESAEEVYARVSMKVDEHRDRAEASISELEDLIPTDMREGDETVVAAADRLLNPWVSDRSGIDEQTRQRIAAHVRTIDDALEGIGECEQEWLEEHKIITATRNSSGNASAWERSIESERADLAQVEAELREAQEQGDKAAARKLIKKVERSRVELSKTIEQAAQIRHESDAARADFETSVQRIKYLRALQDRYNGRAVDLPDEPA